jgi:hypothetical protein
MDCGIRRRDATNTNVTLLSYTTQDVFCIAYASVEYTEKNAGTF